MKTLRMLTAGMLLAAAATAAVAAEEPTVPTITLTAKRTHARALALAIERVAPQAPIVVAVLLPTDMPEAQIDTHLLAIGVLPAPSQE